MGRKFSVLCALFLLLLTVTACNEKSPVPRVDDPKDLKIVLLLPGDKDDMCWNTPNYLGMVNCNKTLGTNIEYIDNLRDDDFESALRHYGKEGYDIVFAAGGQFDAMTQHIASDYPDTIFSVINGASCDTANLFPINIKECESAYLAAVISGHITESGHFGMIAGEVIQSIQDFMSVYGKTALATAKGLGFDGATYELAYANSWDDTALGKQLAENMVDEGCDVVFTCANQLSIGVIAGAAEKNAKIVGICCDQSSLAPDAVIASISYDLTPLYINFIKDYMGERLLMHRVIECGTAENIFVPVYAESCPEEAKVACSQAIEDIKCGKIKPIELVE